MPALTFALLAVFFGFLVAAPVFADGGPDRITGRPFATRSEDPFRGNRVRVSPLLVFQPSEFSRFRLQYNVDNAEFLMGGRDTAHSFWLGLEFLIGQHPAHRF